MTGGSANLFYLILKGLHHNISKKLLNVWQLSFMVCTQLMRFGKVTLRSTYKNSIKGLCPVKVTLNVIQRPQMVLCSSWDEGPLKWDKRSQLSEHPVYQYGSNESTLDTHQWSVNTFKGIVQPFEFGGLTRLIRSGIINWRPGKFFFILMLQSHEMSIKPFTAA
jgi:hypothetical protein